MLSCFPFLLPSTQLRRADGAPILPMYDQRRRHQPSVGTGAVWVLSCPAQVRGRMTTSDRVVGRTWAKDRPGAERSSASVQFGSRGGGRGRDLVSPSFACLALLGLLRRQAAYRRMATRSKTRPIVIAGSCRRMRRKGGEGGKGGRVNHPLRRSRPPRAHFVLVAVSSPVLSLAPTELSNQVHDISSHIACP